MKSYKPHSQRPEFADLTPIPQDEGPNPVVQIAYTDEFKETMNYFRAIVQRNEMSERALLITEEAIELNPANYTAWHFRRLVLDALNYDLSKEIEYLNRVSEDNPKNYQIWYHRQALIEKLRVTEGEKEFVEKMFDDDSKNYHVWTYRQWLVKEFSLWEGELDFVERLLAKDLRNNSAWNYRFFVIQNTTDDFEKNIQVRRDEIDFAFKYILMAPNNESPWNYAKGMTTFKLDEKSEEYKELLQYVEEKTRSVLNKVSVNPHANYLLFCCLLRLGRLQEALSACHTLQKVDGIRRKYWAFRAEQVQNLINSL
ncbi:hypothetical protein FDP41_002384 [Naegleria fowleri]|uniref:Protein farnesyltransferase/geranylgeranyltransferase type-1 subunit alpha n=1 Tax=Naegleria fowleri TaxID=5763 RepID=A0A6A5BW97_NAEFO|nr:uncharacterized protein FDP41_002384 [Naegleria fowleri]KAF0978564.1 hypothetical protein FDP41_002384 [Naegleria fowleri]